MATELPIAATSLVQRGSDGPCSPAQGAGTRILAPPRHALQTQLGRTPTCTGLLCHLVVNALAQALDLTPAAHLLPSVGFWSADGGSTGHQLCDATAAARRNRCPTGRIDADPRPYVGDANVRTGHIGRGRVSGLLSQRHVSEQPRGAAPMRNDLLRCPHPNGHADAGADNSLRLSVQRHGAL